VKRRTIILEIEAEDTDALDLRDTISRWQHVTRVEILDDGIVRPIQAGRPL